MGEHLYKQLSAAYDLGFEAGTYDVKHHQAGDILASATAMAKRSLPRSSLPRTRLAFSDYGQGYADAVGDHWYPDTRRKELTKLQAYADRLPQERVMTAQENPIAKPVLIALGVGGAALVAVVAWRVLSVFKAPVALPAPVPAPSPPTPLTPVEPPLPAPESGMWVPAQSMTTGNGYLVVFTVPDGKPKPTPQEFASSAGSHMAMPTLIYWPNSGMPWPVELTSAPASIDQTKVAVITFQWTGAPQTAQQLAAGDAQYVMEWHPVSNA